MKAIVKQSELARGLGLVSRVIPNRGQLPILSNVLIETEGNEIWLTGTNLELGMKIVLGGKVEEEGAITVPARSITEFVSSINEGNVTLESKGEKVMVKSERSEASFGATAASEFPVMPKIKEETKGVNLPVKVIIDTGKEIIFAAASDESRPVLTGVQIKNGPSGVGITATDGFRLSRLVVNREKVNLGKDVLILPSRTMGELARMVSEDKRGEIEMILAEENNQVLFKLEGAILISRILEGNFPDTDKIIPQEYKTKIIADKEELLKAVRAASIFARESSNVVKLKTGNGILTVAAAAAQTGEGKIDVDAEIEGEELEIIFNYRYVLDYLSNINAERVTLKANGALAPGVFGVENREEIIHLIMPVRI